MTESRGPEPGPGPEHTPDGAASTEAVNAHRAGAPSGAGTITLPG
ncbi:hypothetical protein AB0I54_39200 [Streptomyces sp. NPDC050625]|jgi:hypothetical protein